MTRFAQGFLDELRARVPLSSLLGLAWDRHKTHPGKGQFWACCPFHGEKSASFHVDDLKGFYHCFGCKQSGDAIAWLVDHKGMQFGEAVAELARRAGIALPAPDPEAAVKERARASLYEVMAAAQAYFQARLADQKAIAATVARAYLTERKVPEAEWEVFGIGFAPQATSVAAALQRFSEVQLLEAGLLARADDGRIYDRFRNRIMFPIHDAQGRVVGFGARALDPAEKAKYLNSPETPLFDKGRLLYNRHRAADPARDSGKLVIAEGYLDVIALARAGLAAVAPLGTALSADQLAQAWRLAPEPILCFDGDPAGKAAAGRAIETALPLLQPGRSLSIATLPEDKDPDEYLNSHGAEALSQRLNEGVALVDALFEKLTSARDVSTPERVAALNAAVAAAASSIADNDIREVYKLALQERLTAFFREHKAKAPKLKVKKPPKAAGGGDEGWSETELDKMNGAYAVVITGQKAVVLRDGAIDAGHSFERFSFISVDAFRLWLANRLVWLGARRQPMAELWLTHPKRRQYRGLEFVPAAPGEKAARDNYYNLWGGYTVDPAANPELSAPWLNHVRENLAGGDDDLFIWIVAWFAALIQFPRVRFGVSLVLMGGEGAGKTITGKIVGSLFAPNYFLIDDPRYLTGQFNAHLASCLLLQADEGFWAGDKQAEGRLKGLVTSDLHMIEYKGVDPIRVMNYVHLLVTSNSDWVVPVGIDGRRYAVVDLSGRRQQDADYFGNLDQFYERADARAALLYELAHWRIDQKALRAVPKTAALLTQKVRTFNPETEFIFEFLDRGTLPAGHAWPDWVTVEDFHKHYLKRCETMGVRRPQNVRSFGQVLARLVPSIRRKRRVDGLNRVYVYEMPALAAARADFDLALRQPVDWGEELEEMQPMAVPAAL